VLTSLNPTLVIAPAIERQFLTGTIDMSLAIARDEMVRLRSHCDLGDQSNSENPVLDVPHCLMVVHEGKLCGIFTERDLVRLIAEEANLATITLGEAIRIPVISLCCDEQSDIFTALDLLRHHHLRHLPIVDAEDHPLGIVTYDSLRNALPPIKLLTRLHCVRDVMTEDLITAPTTHSLLAVAQLMADHQVGCVLICDETGDRPRPVGIVTERDIVQFQSLELNLRETPVATVMSSPLFTLAPESSLWEAHQTMNRHHVHRLIVMDKDDMGEGEKVLGLVSQTSLFQVLRPTDMYQMIELLQTMVDDRTQELALKNQQLQLEIKDRKRAEEKLQQAHDHLKEIVKERTQQLHDANIQLKEDLARRDEIQRELEKTLKDLQHTQIKLIQTEKMSGLGQLVAGIAHEINNPINFIYGNLQHAGGYIDDILETLSLYEKYYPQPPQEIRANNKKIDLDFLRDDVKQLLNSMYSGVDRIRNLLLSLRTFSRLDESKLKMADIHQGLDSTLLLIQNRLQGQHNFSRIHVIREYETIPQIECYPSQLNQVFLNLLLNAIDAVEEAQQQRHYYQPEMMSVVTQTMEQEQATQSYRKPQIRVKTGICSAGDRLMISISDNGLGISPEIQQKLFDPFFTTKPVGKGTGLGLSISYQIVIENHGGTLECISNLNQGTEFVITLPVSQAAIAA
jgi:signal transduction histidine kinase/predicted transcriptional regulator